MLNITRENHTLIDDIGKYEAFIISVFIITLTVALTTHSLSETLYGTIMGSFLGYTFARIFNHVQEKE